MEFNTLEEIEVRKTEIAEEMRADGADLDALEAEIKALETRKAEIVEEQRKAQVEVAEGAGKVIENKEERKVMNLEEIRSSEAYANAYANYIKNGDDTECRSLLTTNTVSGSVPVPTVVYDIVKTAWEKEGIMSRVKKAYVKGNLKVGFEISASGAVIHTEGGNAVSEETLTLGIVELVPQSIKKWISISDEVMDLRGEAFLQYIYDELAYQIAKKAADTLVANIIACTTGASSATVGVPQYATSTIAIDIVANALGKLSDEADNPVVIMNKATWPLFKAVQYANSYGVDPFEGLDVVFNNSIMPFSSASTTGDTYMIVGDLGQGALANFPNGDEIEFKFDDKTDMTKDLVRVLGREFIAIEPVAPNAFVKIVHA